MTSSPYYSGDLGEAATGAAVDIPLDQMFGDFDGCTGDLFELVWEACGGGGGEDDGGAGVGETTMQPAGVPRFHLLSLQKAPDQNSDDHEVRLPEPPSDHEMAAWLSAIVTGCGGGDAVRAAGGDDHQAPAAVEPGERPWTEKVETKLPRKEEKRAKHKARRNPHYAQTYGLKGKRRRSKTNEKFKMLQQLVPGGDKLSQSSTLDRTIHYMKSLQQQLQAMYPTMMRPAAAVYPVVQPPAPFMPPPVGVGVARLPLPPRAVPGVVTPTAEGSGMAVGLHPPFPAVVPFGPVLSLMPAMMPAAAPRLIYPSTSLCDHRQGSSSGSSTLI